MYFWLFENTSIFPALESSKTVTSSETKTKYYKKLKHTLSKTLMLSSSCNRHILSLLMRRPKDSIRDMTLVTTEFISEEKMRDLKNYPKLETVEEQSSSLTRNITYYQYEEVMRELENVKNELEKLKLGMFSVLEEKTEAENQIQASSSKVLSNASSMRKLRNEIRDVRDERAFTEFAKIEAMREFEEIEAQREEEISQFSAFLEDTKRKTNKILEEIDRQKNMEVELSATIDDIGFLEISLEMAKASEKNVRKKGKGLQLSEELILAKNELEKKKAEAVQFMASMDVIRKELVRVCEETEKLKKVEKMTEIRVFDLNSKILQANKKLETVSESEAKARAIVSNLTLDLVQLKTEIEASKKEKGLIREEIEKIETIIKKYDIEIELGEQRLDEAIHELESVKSSELKALEKLKDLVEGTMENRAKRTQEKSSITISKFEYEYLKERAVGADEIADKKVAAAQAWIEALKASEREILMKTEIEIRRNKELNEKQENKTTSKTKPAILNGSGISTPIRKTRHRKSITLAARSMSRSSITMRRKKNGSTPSIALHENQSIDTDL